MQTIYNEELERYKIDRRVLLCDEWCEAQAKAFRLLVNRSAT